MPSGKQQSSTQAIPAVPSPHRGGADVVVVGAGVAGLVAAHDLAGRGLRVLVLESAARVGGQLRTAQIDGTPVDVGAESVHLGPPAVAALVDSLGLRVDAVEAIPGRTLLPTGRRLRDLPDGMTPTGPTRLLPVVRSGVLSWRGILRAGLEPLHARPVGSADVAVGAFLRRRYGHEVVDRFVDPLLGGIHAGDVDRLGVAGAAPQLLADARSGRSLLLRRRRPAGGAAAVSWPGGTPTLARALAAGLDVRTDAPVTSVRQVTGGYEVVGAAGVVRARAVVLAVPAAVGAALLRDLAPAAAQALAPATTASVVTVLARVPRLPAALAGVTGLLVPSSAGLLLRSATVLSARWPHLADGGALLRLAAGRAHGPDVTRLDDATLVDGLLADLTALTGETGRPTSVLVHRWADAFGQLEVGHVERVAAARAALAAHPGLALAGAAYDGPGVAACTASGVRAARACSAVPAAG